MSAKDFTINGTRRRYGTVTILTDENYKAVQLHSTRVFENENGLITLNTGGWYTVTTKTAINSALAQTFGHGTAPRIYCEKGDWFIYFPSVLGYDAYTADFETGMSFRLTAKGFIIE